MDGTGRMALKLTALLVVTAGIVIGMRVMLSPGELGPTDGHDLPPTDLDRVVVGDVAPDFSLRSLSDEVVTLSQFGGEQNVVLVFYRGHW